MADNQARPGAVATSTSPVFQRSITVGTFGRTFATYGNTSDVARKIKAIWRSEVGPIAHGETPGQPA